MEPILKQKIDKFFNPKSVAVIGASSRVGQFSNTLVRRLSQSSLKGHSYPINPNLDELYGLKCYPSIKDVPEKVDLAYIMVGASLVPSVMRECVQNGVESCVIHTSGFAEAGDEGRQLQEEVLEIARSGGIRLIGPNCLGVYNHRSGLFVDHKVPEGSAAIISSSGGMNSAITIFGRERGMRFSKAVSCGNQADITIADLIEYLGEDAETSVILMYMENVGDGQKFMHALKKVTRTKPVLIMKGGRTAAGSRAASSHSAALAGDYDVFKAAARQAGAILCDDIEDLVDVGLACQFLSLPRGRNVTVVTTPGGAGVTAADACDEFQLGCPEIGAETTAKLRKFLPASVSTANPIDLGMGRYQVIFETLDVLFDDDSLNMFLVIGSDRDSFVETLIENKDKLKRKPVAVSIMNLNFSSPAEYARMTGSVGGAGIPVYPTARRAIKAMSQLALYAEYVEKSAPLASPSSGIEKKQPTRALEIVAAAKAAGQRMLTESQAMDLFDSYGIPVVKHGLARSFDESLEVVNKIGYPVVVKVSSPDVVHKTDAGGVVLNVSNADELKQAFEQVTTLPLKSVPDASIEGALIERMVKAQFELSVGMVRDRQFGHVIMFGLGGILIEVLRDVGMRINPLSRQDALEMMGEIQAHTILEGVRGMKPVDKDELVEIILALDAVARDIPEITEIDINPIAATRDGLVAVDARIRIA